MQEEVMHCWPTAWIAAAKMAGLASGMNAETGKFFVRGGDAMRMALGAFAQEIADSATAAERERCLRICRLNDPEGFATHLVENGQDDDA